MALPDWLPSKGLIREHYEYGVWATDAPPIFHVASMATAIASVVADKASLAIADTPYPLHVWTMLVGRSTADRKTTSARLAINRIERKFRQRVQRIYGSPEALLGEMKRNPCVVLYVPEGGAFFEQRNAGYWRHARNIFMDLYDHTDLFERKLVNNTVSIRNPRISILAATARPLLERHTRDSDWLGGFLARFLMIGGEPQEFKPQLRADKKIEARLEAMVETIMTTQWGSIALSSAALRALDDFSREIHEDTRKSAHGLGPSLGRLPETAKRLAALFEISIQAPNPPEKRSDGSTAWTVVNREAALCAINLCRASRDVALRELADLTLPMGFRRDWETVANMIRNQGPGGLTRSRILRFTRMKARDLDQLLTTMTDSGEIRLASVGRSGRGRPAQRYVHEHSKHDIERLAARAAEDPTTPVSVINMVTGEICLDGLPVAVPPPPWAAVDDDEPVDPDAN